MRSTLRWLCGGILLLSACATTGVPKSVRAKADERVTFAQVRAGPSAARGKVVLWGGEILNLKNAKEGTYVEILQAPLDGQGKPKSTELSEGRFIAFTERYLDKLVYTSGRSLSVLGTLQGAKRQPLEEGEIDYEYPLLQAGYLKLWQAPPPETQPPYPHLQFGVGLGAYSGSSPHWRDYWGMGLYSPYWYYW